MSDPAPTTYTVFPFTVAVGGKPDLSLLVRGIPLEFLKKGNSALEKPYRWERSREEVWGGVGEEGVGGRRQVHSSHTTPNHTTICTTTLHNTHSYPHILHTHLTPTPCTLLTDTHTLTRACRSSCFTVALRFLLLRALGHRLM